MCLTLDKPFSSSVSAGDMHIGPIDFDSGPTCDSWMNKPRNRYTAVSCPRTRSRIVEKTRASQSHINPYRDNRGFICRLLQWKKRGIWILLFGRNIQRNRKIHQNTKIVQKWAIFSPRYELFFPHSQRGDTYTIWSSIGSNHLALRKYYTEAKLS